MFNTAELGRSLSKEDYKEQEPQLRTELLTVQRELVKADFPVLILINGVDGAGKGDIINLLNEWMDTRNIQTAAFGEPTEEQRHRPHDWRYWMALPGAGQIGIFAGAWYTKPIIDRAYDRLSVHDLSAVLAHINSFEKTLVDEGALMIKLWLHVSKEQQRKRFKKLEKNPATAWRVTKQDHKNSKLYDYFRTICERVLRSTSTGEAPWFVVEGGNWRYRNVTVARYVADRIKRRLESRGPSYTPEPEPPIDDPYTILDTLDMESRMEKADYRMQLGTLQGRLNRLARRARRQQVGVILVFEGADAAGKGGAIRRVIESLDARQYRVIQIAAPTDEEKAHHYLWRFWRHLPRLGRFTIYDRSWYGRVLVERVEGFARREEWMRGYKEINDFEEQLCDHGIALCKFWLHISREEQLRRFEERERVPWKRYKITEEDYRNREKANQYEAAANDMIERTSTEYAPWTLVPSEDKKIGRVRVLETVCDTLERALDRKKLADARAKYELAEAKTAAKAAAKEAKAALKAEPKGTKAGKGRRKKNKRAHA